MMAVGYMRVDESQYTHILIGCMVGNALAAGQRLGKQLLAILLPPSVYK